MLKHKIRKSRKNILSLLEAVSQEDSSRAEYSKVTKKEKRQQEKDKKKADEGYYTESPEKVSDAPDGARERARSEPRRARREAPARNTEEPAVPAGPAVPAAYGLVPVLLPWRPARRSSPEEDFLATLQGVQGLLEQQRGLLGEIQQLQRPPAGTQSPAGTQPGHSSMQALRRILETEELQRFSQAIAAKLEGGRLVEA